MLLLLPHGWIPFREVKVVEEGGIGYNHLIMFAALGFFVELSRRKSSQWFWLNVLILYGASTEIIQHFLPDRNCKLFDICQDFSGAYFGLVLGRLSKYTWIPMLGFLHYLRQKFFNKERTLAKSGAQSSLSQTANAAVSGTPVELRFQAETPAENTVEDVEKNANDGTESPSVS